MWMWNHIILIRILLQKLQAGKIVGSCYDNMGCSVALDDLWCHMNTISEYNSMVEGLFIEGYTGCTQKKK